MRIILDNPSVTFKSGKYIIDNINSRVCFTYHQALCSTCSNSFVALPHSQRKNKACRSKRFSFSFFQLHTLINALSTFVVFSFSVTNLPLHKLVIYILFSIRFLFLQKKIIDKYNNNSNPPMQLYFNQKLTIKSIN